MNSQPSKSQLGKAALFLARHKPIPGGMTFAVKAADTCEKNQPSPLQFTWLRIEDNQKST